MAIDLEPESRKALIASIQRYADENLDEDMGELKAGLFLDFCLAEVGPAIYNRAVADARAFMLDRLADLENTCYEPELTYKSSTASS